MKKLDIETKTFTSNGKTVTCTLDNQECLNYKNNTLEVVAKNKYLIHGGRCEYKTWDPRYLTHKYHKMNAVIEMPQKVICVRNTVILWYPDNVLGSISDSNLIVINDEEKTFEKYEHVVNPEECVWFGITGTPVTGGLIIKITNLCDKATYQLFVSNCSCVSGVNLISVGKILLNTGSFGFIYYKDQSIEATGYATLMNKSSLKLLRESQIEFRKMRAKDKRERQETMEKIKSQIKYDEE